MKNLISQNMAGYSLLDSGYGKKLEVIAGLTVERPCPQAIWAPRLGENDWKQATSICIRKNDGGGTWKHRGDKEPQNLLIEHEQLKFKLKFTSFGHCGVFFEQKAVWETLSAEATRLQAELGRPLKFLNLFGYTGCASLAVAATGAEIFHVDSSKGVLNWGRENAELSKLDMRKIKFVQEDVLAFVKHSLRKGFKYDGILADPPSWGHGANKEVWEFDQMIHELVSNCFNILTRENSLFFLSSHTHGVQSEALRNLMNDHRSKKEIVVGELGVRHSHDERILPAGIYSFAKNIH
ncbi:MAG: class I SAM-dependent methyltransferase [Bacteriovorax sp.]|jgi:23S rRNA (cytosine1962-C5)-methyltransferase|nr:class I SAM-dependent methyltransferase [Bacteriovorax sp.]